MTINQLPRERRHTYQFLGQAREFAPVFLDTEVDMSAVTAHREEARARGERYSTVSYVLYAAARVLVGHPEANGAITGWSRPRVARYGTASGKLALDKTVNGHRVVLTAVLPDLDSAGLADIQAQVDHYRDGDAANMPEFAGPRMLQKLPVPLGRLLYRAGMRSLRRRPELVGTFAVSSLGHRPVDAFHSVGGTTITLGMGQVADRPVARRGEVVVVPAMRLSLAFDHRVIDGAEAADVLGEIKEALENFKGEPA
ncbi:MAG: 2-oxo acid dehydrogenase subunit E2 [Mycobacteriales bacterium]